MISKVIEAENQTSQAEQHTTAAKQLNERCANTELNKIKINIEVEHQIFIENSLQMKRKKIYVD